MFMHSALANQIRVEAGKPRPSFLGRVVIFMRLWRANSINARVLADFNEIELADARLPFPHTQLILGSPMKLAFEAAFLEHGDHDVDRSNDDPSA
jgi:hypothetical protein